MAALLLKAECGLSMEPWKAKAVPAGKSGLDPTRPAQTILFRHFLPGKEGWAGLLSRPPALVVFLFSCIRKNGSA
jgi:hypothetical protein